MMEATQSSAAPRSQEGLLTDLLGEIADRVQAGETVDIEAYCAAHPAYADRLRQLLPAVELMAEFGRSAASGQASAPPVESDLEAPGRLGDFRIIRELGRGGMGVVYQAEQISLGRHVALKVLPFAGAMDARQLQRFKNEAQAAAHLHHTNIVPVHFVGSERGVHYYAMQLIQGCTLAGVIRELRHLQKSEEAARQAAKDAKEDGDATASFAPLRLGASPSSDPSPTPVIAGLSTKDSHKDPAFFRTVAELRIQAAEGLEHAHQMGVVHRDIKPGNLLLDQRGNLWVTDFGLAQFQSGAELTMTGDLLGTLRYMSPEQALAQRVVVDQRTDIYSLGVTLYELLTLEAPFNGKDRQELLRQIAFEEPRPLRRMNKSIPQELQTIIGKAIEKNPADRYATANGMANDLRNWLADRPIRAKRPSLAHRVRKVARRHPGVLVTAGVATVLALLLGTAGLAMSNYRIREEQIRTQTALDGEAEQREIAEAALNFVTDKVFVAARPVTSEGGLGHDVTLRRAIEAALPFVASGFTDKPLVEARLRMTVGRSYIDLGEGKKASEQFQTARRLYTNCEGADHPDTLFAMHELAVSYAECGQYRDAVELGEETLKNLREKLGPDNPHTLRTMENLAGDYRNLGRYTDALRLLETVLKSYKAKLGLDHPDALQSMNSVAMTYSEMGRHTDALTLYQETLAQCKTKLGTNNFLTLSCMNNLAGEYVYLDRNEEGLKLFEEVHPLFVSKLGRDHPLTLSISSNLAQAYISVGRQKEALPLLEQTLVQLRTRLGPGHPDTLLTMHTLGNCYSDLGRYAEALNLHQEVFLARKAQFGPHHPGTVLEMYDVACDHAAEMSRCPDPAKKAKLAALAMEWLQNSVAAGYADVAQIKKDKDLNALRDRADFKKLVADMEAAQRASNPPKNGENAKAKSAEQSADR
jgi:eukaryotic-like serine/threonine-protein kinase